MSLAISIWLVRAPERRLPIFEANPLLAAVSKLMQNAFEYADALAEADAKSQPPADGEAREAKGHHRRSSSVQNPNRPYLNLATFRMCVLADELLESFFDEFRKSWRLEAQPQEPAIKPTGAQGFFGGLMKAVLTDENKSRFYHFADEVGKRLDIQTVEQVPSIGKLDIAAAMAPPRDRETLLSTAMTPSSSIGTPHTSRSPLLQYDPLSHAAMREPAYPAPIAIRTTEDASRVQDQAQAVGPPPFAIQRAQQSFIEQRPQFAIDDVGEEEEEGESGQGSRVLDGKPGQVDDGDLMNEVDQFLADDDEASAEPQVSEEHRKLARSPLSFSVALAHSQLTHTRPLRAAQRRPEGRRRPCGPLRSGPSKPCTVDRHSEEGFFILHCHSSSTHVSAISPM